MSTLDDLWDDFCREHSLAGSSVPLFAADEAGNVETFQMGETAGRCFDDHQP